MCDLIFHMASECRFSARSLFVSNAIRLLETYKGETEIVGVETLGLTTRQWICTKFPEF